jgi:cytochrome c oxidase subunit 2
VLALTLGLAGSLLYMQSAHAVDHSTLDGKGPVASAISRLSWVLFAIAALVFLVVVILLITGVLKKPKHRPDQQGIYRSSASETRIIAIGGIAIPAIILIAIFAYSLRDMVTLAKPDHDAAMTIDVIGHQWWWEARYENQDVTTANEIHIPTGEPIEFKLTTSDVIHSFWVPNLSDKMDMIPGKTNSLWLQADDAGTYYGQCAEFCGDMHAFMGLMVIAQPPSDYAAWLANQQQNAAASNDPLVTRGEQIFLGSACVYCHTVRGTAASGMIGPDLTHIASRQTLAAVTVDNSAETLGAWIMSPEQIKPDSLMSGTDFTPEELKALIAFLESLK